MTYLKKHPSILLSIPVIVMIILINVCLSMQETTIVADEPVVEVIPEVTRNITLNIIETEPVQEITIEQEVVPVRIDCPLDDEIQQMIADRCDELDLDFPFVMAVMFKESSFRSDVISSDGGDHGLMQINKVNHKWLSEELGVTDFLNPEQNVRAGTYILKRLFDKYEDPAKVLMCYNMGESNAKKLWNKGVYTSKYAEAILAKADEYKSEIERVG